MGMEHLMSVVNPSSGYALQRGPDRHDDGPMEEMKELQRQRRETKMETCQSTESRSGAIRCPIPCKSSRPYRECDFKTSQDLSDFIVGKASPPYFMGSPPVRASNPLVHDTHFCSWKVQNVDQSPGIPIPTKSCSVDYWARGGSVTKS
ncbi:uncharacterized protein LOC124684392 isoform X1 [Lolium rigidum]|uniref:uncharacterized protein LOC124684392 isoform X1 n=1 Tax=Lolium rigidum TaxID=89674 RepID=UPI001F5C3863|nr:uncharacterized protein LOC124684392 isoform X1 [Lolium rigidum]